MPDLDSELQKVRRKFDETLGCGFILTIIAIIAVSVGLAGIVSHIIEDKSLKNDLQLLFGGLGFLIYSFGFWNKFEKRIRGDFESQIRKSSSRASTEISPSSDQVDPIVQEGQSDQSKSNEPE